MAKKKSTTLPALPSDEPRRTHKDQLFKLLFERRFADLVNIVAPSAASSLALKRSVPLPTELYSQMVGGEQFLLDLLYRVPLRKPSDKHSLAAVHIETEAKWRELTTERMWEYFVQIWHKYRCPVVPIVVYLSGGRPGVSVEPFKLGVGEPKAVVFSCFSLGLSGADAEVFLRRREPLAAALAAWMSSDLSPAEHSLRCHLRLAQSHPDASERQLLFNCVDTALQLRGDDLLELKEAMNVEMKQSSDERMRQYLRDGITWADRCEAKGREEGEARGELRGMQRVLLDLLVQRFGRLPQPVREHVEGISSAASLRRLAKKVSTASSLEELGLVPRSARRHG